MFLMSKYFQITRLLAETSEASDAVVHNVTSKRRPSFTLLRGLTPEKLRITKFEFDQLLTLGMMGPSRRPSSSAFHMVLKQTSGGRKSSDYYVLNSAIIRDH